MKNDLQSENAELIATLEEKEEEVAELTQEVQRFADDVEENMIRMADHYSAMEKLKNQYALQIEKLKSEHSH